MTGLVTDIAQQVSMEGTPESAQTVSAILHAAVVVVVVRHPCAS